MLDGNEKQNFYSLMRLRDVVVEGSKPLVFWIGAGTSRWCGYPSWEQLAAQLHKKFSRCEALYNRSVGAELLTKGALTDIGATMDSATLKTILKFRSTNEGIALRKEVLEQLKVSAGSEFISSVNAGFKRTIPFTSLDKSRRKFSALLAAEPSVPRLTRAITHNQFYSDAAISLWRKHSLQQLNAVCQERKTGPYDPCPCGSGEKLKFCCLEALKLDG